MLLFLVYESSCSNNITYGFLSLLIKIDNNLSKYKILICLLSKILLQISLKLFSGLFITIWFVKNFDFNCFYRFIDKKTFLFLDKKIKFLRLRFPSTELYLLATKYNLKIK